MFCKTVVILAVIHVITAASFWRSACDDLPNHRNFHLLPHGSECLALTSSPRIMGGRDVQLGEYPWLVVLFLNISSLGSQVMWCSGSIINSKYIITAAHCMPSDIIDLYDVVVRVGEHDLLTTQDCDENDCAPLPISYGVEQYIPHPQYDSSTHLNDLGLIRIRGEMRWNDYVYPACLPSTCSLMETDFEGKNLIVAGYGALIDGPKTMDSKLPQKVTLVGTNLDVCATSYGQERSEKQICVGGSMVGNLHKDACHGDSGGPLIFHGHHEGIPARPYLVGLVSSGENCTVAKTEQAPGIYTKVASYMDWILDTIHE